MPDLLPINATGQETALERTTARVGDVDVPIRDLWNPDTCPESLLPWLAWAFSVDEWDSTWPVHIKRAQIRDSINIHRKKGTAFAVKQVVSSFGASLVMREWFESGGSPGTFDLILSMGGSTPADAAYQAQITAAIDKAKNLRSHYTLSLGLTALGQMGLQGAARVIHYRHMCFNET